MKVLTCSLSLLLLGAKTIAQTPANFSVQSAQPLDVFLQPSNNKVTPGLLVPQADTLTAPSLISPDAGDTRSYVALMIDSAVPVLHWFQAGLVTTSNGSLQQDPDAAAGIIGTPYISPMPPAGSGPHNYVILLFDQPSNFTVPSNYSSINPPTVETDVVGFNVANFVGATNLGAPVGANYFRVLNGTAAETSSYATATQTGNGAPFTATSTAPTTPNSSSQATSQPTSTGVEQSSGADSLWVKQSFLSWPVALLICMIQ